MWFLGCHTVHILLLAMPALFCSLIPKPPLNSVSLTSLCSSYTLSLTTQVGFFTIPQIYQFRRPSSSSSLYMDCSSLSFFKFLLKYHIYNTFLLITLFRIAIFTPLKHPKSVYFSPWYLPTSNKLQNVFI